MSYTINPYSIEEIGRAGYGRITCKIHGFWSSDPITLYIDRRNYGNDKGWHLKMSHSSGGREPNEVACDMQASINFAAAMTQIANIGKSLLSLHGEALEKFYEDERARLKAEFEAENAALQAKVDADPAIGRTRATGIVAEMIATLTNIHMTERKFYRRGFDAITWVRVEKFKHTRFKMNGLAISKKELIEEIAKLSRRTAETA